MDPSSAAQAEPSVTVLTPTIGRPGLAELMASVDAQRNVPRPCHLLLWDATRAPGAPVPEALDTPHRFSLVLPARHAFPGFHHRAPGSALRAIGLLLATTPWVTFADDDVCWAPDHMARLLAAAQGLQWASTLRRMRTESGERLGVDRFESVGDDADRQVPYEMIDNNCMLFRREWGVRAAPLYRETRSYNDDRLMYAMLKAEAGPRGRTGRATLDQCSPPALVEMFRAACSAE